MLHHLVNRRQAAVPPVLSPFFEQSLPPMLTKHHDLALGLPTWVRTHEHMLLNCPPILLQVSRGVAQRRKESNAKFSSSIYRLFIVKRGLPIATSAALATPPSQIPRQLSLEPTECEGQGPTGKRPRPVTGWRLIQGGGQNVASKIATNFKHVFPSSRTHVLTLTATTVSFCEAIRSMPMRQNFASWSIAHG